MSETIAELRALTDQELIERHDRHAPSVVIATKHYLDELARRDSARREEQMLAMTRRIVNLTVQIRSFTAVVTLATLVALGLSVYAALR